MTISLRLSYINPCTEVGRQSCHFEARGGNSFSLEVAILHKEVANPSTWQVAITSQVGGKFLHKEVVILHKEVAILHKEVAILHREVAILHKEVGILHKEVPIPHKEVGGGYFASPKMIFSLTSRYMSICQSYSKFSHFEAGEVIPSHFRESQNDTFT